MKICEKWFEYVSFEMYKIRCYDYTIFLHQSSDWDFWLGSESIRQDRSVVVPEVPRVKHGGVSGVHVVGPESALLIADKPITHADVDLDVKRLVIIRFSFKKCTMRFSLSRDELETFLSERYAWNFPFWKICLKLFVPKDILETFRSKRYAWNFPFRKICLKLSIPKDIFETFRSEGYIWNFSFRKIWLKVPIPKDMLDTFRSWLLPVDDMRSEMPLRLVYPNNCW